MCPEMPQITKAHQCEAKSPSNDRNRLGELSKVGVAVVLGVKLNVSGKLIVEAGLPPRLVLAKPSMPGYQGLAEFCAQSQRVRGHLGSATK